MRQSINTSITLIIVTSLAMACLAVPALASLADSAGTWEIQPFEAVLVSSDGAKVSMDLGAARTAALGHLDSDGVIDLVVAFGSGDKGFASVTLGDPRFRLGPHHDRERELSGLPPEKPFATEVVVHQLPFAPDWAAVGDWDSDGDFDVVFASRTSLNLFWMAGDGRGGLDAGRKIDLGGGVTAFASGDVNRRDGLHDLVIAIDGRGGPALLVFESPGGALKTTPERFQMPGAVTSLAIDWLDGDVWKDIAAASGNQVVVVSGRDRNSVSTRARRDTVSSAAKASFDFESKVLDLAAGFFTNRDREAQLAVRLVDGTTQLIRNVEREFEISRLGVLPHEGRLSSARTSGLAGHDLLISGLPIGHLGIFHAEASKAGSPSLATVLAPENTHRELIAGRLNVDTRDDLILLREDGAIEIAASKTRLALVVTTTDDSDDGTCNGTHCSLREAINDANALPSGSTITFDLGLGSTIVPGSQLPTLTQGAATVIDGTVGSGMFTGLLTLQGASAGNAQGLKVTGGNATIMNVDIRGFTLQGLSLEDGTNNTVEGCRLGVDGTGGGSDPNQSGIRVYNSNDNTIGGTAPGAGNICSGNNFYGVQLYGVSDGNVLLGNRIGVNTLGDARLSNGDNGVQSNYALRSQIGSAISGGGNVISGNGLGGIRFDGSVNQYIGGTVVVGNAIGLDILRTTAIPNGHISGGNGIFVSQEENLKIGGSNVATMNVISGNIQSGIEIGAGSPDAQISGNYIGTDGTGLIAIPNATGILMSGAELLTIGGGSAGQGNLISGNQFSGIRSSIQVSNAIDIYGNRIGQASDGSPLGNGDSGVFLEYAVDVSMGGLGDDAPNIIAYNGEKGVVVGTGSSGVNIAKNSIFDNALLGIDLGNDLVTVNDSLDVDSGPNTLQNFPLITAVDPELDTVTILMFSTPNTAFSLNFYQSPTCSAFGHGEGKNHLGGWVNSTNASGQGSGTYPLINVTPGAAITATATDPDGNTSEFSTCFTVPIPAGHIFSDDFESGDTSAWGAK